MDSNNLLKHVLLTLFLLISLNVSAQKKDRSHLDPLLRQIAAAKPDSNKVNLLLQCGYAWVALLKPDSAIFADERALQAAQSLKWEKGVAKAYRDIGIQYFAQKKYAIAYSNFNTAFAHGLAAKDDDLTVKSLSYAAATLYYQNKFNQTVNYLLAGIAQFKKRGKTSLERDEYIELGYYYEFRYNYERADNYYNIALGLGNIPHVKYPPSGLVGGIARFYQNLHGTPQAIAFLLKAEAIYKKEGEQYDMANNYDTLGDIAEDGNDYNASEAYYNKALIIAKRINNVPLLALTENSLGWIYYLKKDYYNAYIHTKQSMVYSKTDPDQLIGNEGALGSIYRDAPDSILVMGGVQAGRRYETSVALLTKWINYTKGSLNIRATTDALKELSLTYEKMHRYADAFKTYKDYVNKKDSLDSLKDEKNVLLKQARLGYAHKEDSLKYQQNITSAELKGKKLQSYFFIGGIAVLLILSAFIWFNFVNQRKSNRLLAQANDKITVTNHELNEQREEITAQRDQLASTLGELKAAQQQLVQSEKMASLGELTAGIAHEIQNPLNFVNNFSDVNREMLEELKAESEKPKAEWDEQLVIELINDLAENEQKINHHGKRADGIVKGMLEHSRTSTGQKEPTDLNKLADEYLRLSYHGFRAKDKSFNSELVTDFEESLPPVNVIPQDIGRVLLNLFNNAFYAVQQKQQNTDDNYKAIVEIATAVKNQQVQLTVKDNGTGIPDAIKDKIMQPFFTTKPTGEGTGLGLSLSYDIVVKGHGGNITVNSMRGGGSEFNIQIPLTK